MLEKRKRISKKEIKQDKLVTSYYKFYNFFFEYQAKILIGVGAVALVVVAIFLYSNKKESDNIEATNKLAKVITFYNAGAYKESIEGKKEQNIEGLMAIVEKYGGTEQGEAARIFLANAYLYTGNLEAAKKEYEDYSGSNSLFKATALAGEAYYYESKQDFEKAADLFRKAATVSKTNPSNVDYLLKAGINLFKLNKIDEAKSIFESIKKEHQMTSQAQEVEKYLAQIQS